MRRNQRSRSRSCKSRPHFAGEISADKVRQILTYLRTLPPES